VLTAAFDMIWCCAWNNSSIWDSACRKASPYFPARRVSCGDGWICWWKQRRDFLDHVFPRIFR
jgi:hypothetical protein